MQSRMKNIVTLVPDTLKALQALKACAEKSGVPAKTLALIELRASQINGCGVCVDLHGRELKKLDEGERRILGVAAWRDMPWFNDAERAALALTEALTRLADRPEGVPDEIWSEAARHYDEAGLASLVIAIANINVWNRFNVATRQVAGQWG